MATLTRVLHRTGLGLHSNLVTLQSCLCFGRSTANHRIIAFQSQMVMVMAIRQRPLVALLLMLLLLLTTTTTTICSICSISSATKPNTCREQMKDELPLGHSKVNVCEHLRVWRLRNSDCIQRDDFCCCPARGGGGCPSSPFRESTSFTPFVPRCLCRRSHPLSRLFHRLFHLFHTLRQTRSNVACRH